MSISNGPSRVYIPYTNAEITSLWVISEDWPRTCSNFFEEINNKYLKSKQLQFIKNNWILLSTVRGTPVSKAPTFYLDANKLGMVGYSQEIEVK